MLTWPLRKIFTKTLRLFKQILCSFNQKIKNHLHIKKKNLHLSNISLYNMIKSKKLLKAKELEEMDDEYNNY